MLLGGLKQKMKFKLTALLATLLLGGSFAYATDASKVSSIPQQCQQLFSDTEKLIAEAEKQPGTHTQVSKIKNKLNQSKKQILEMDLAVQIKSCDHGLAKLNKTQTPQQEN